MLLRLFLLALLPVFGFTIGYLLVLPQGASLKAKPPETEAALTELELRLSYMTFEAEQLELHKELGQLLKQHINARPYEPYAHARLADLYLNADGYIALDAKDAAFGMYNTFNLSSARPRVRHYIASHCVQQSARFVGLDMRLCEQIHSLVPHSVSLPRAASILRVDEQDLRRTLAQSKFCHFPAPDQYSCKP